MPPYEKISSPFDSCPVITPGTPFAVRVTVSPETCPVISPPPPLQKPPALLQVPLSELPDCVQVNNAAMLPKLRSDRRDQIHVLGGPRHYRPMSLG